MEFGTVILMEDLSKILEKRGKIPKELAKIDFAVLGSERKVELINGKKIQSGGYIDIYFTEGQNYQSFSNFDKVVGESQEGIANKDEGTITIPVSGPYNIQFSMIIQQGNPISGCIFRIIGSETGEIYKCEIEKVKYHKFLINIPSVELLQDEVLYFEIERDNSKGELSMVVQEPFFLIKFLEK